MEKVGSAMGTVLLVHGPKEPSPWSLWIAFLSPDMLADSQNALYYYSFYV